MIAVSPDGKYVAGVAPGGKAVDVWASGGTTPLQFPDHVGSHRDRLGSP